MCHQRYNLRTLTLAALTANAMPDTTEVRSRPLAYWVSWEPKTHLTHYHVRTLNRELGIASQTVVLSSKDSRALQHPSLRLA